MIQHTDYGNLLPRARALLDRHADKTKAHLIATGAAMAALAERFGGDTATWTVAGLLHDLDWDRLEKDYQRHCGDLLAEMLAEIQAPPSCWPTSVRTTWINLARPARSIRCSAKACIASTN